jgi:hypothetical protein
MLRGRKLNCGSRWWIGTGSWRSRFWWLGRRSPKQLLDSL